MVVSGSFMAANPDREIYGLGPLEETYRHNPFGTIGPIASIAGLILLVADLCACISGGRQVRAIGFEN